MPTPLKKALYTAAATVHGGRDGHGRSSDGTLDLDIRPPAEMGGAGEGTNPEQLFALGYTACFQSAMAVIGRRIKVDTSGSEVTARVTIDTIEGGAFGLAVELDAHIPGVDEAAAQRVLAGAHDVCPYSKRDPRQHRGHAEADLNRLSAPYAASASETASAVRDCAVSRTLRATDGAASRIPRNSSLDPT